MRVLETSVARWREAAERVYGEAGYWPVLWQAELRAYAVLMVAEDAEEADLARTLCAMACGVQEYAEERGKLNWAGGRV